MIKVQTEIQASINKIWEFWTLPEHIVEWNTPSLNWYTSQAENDLKVGGKFKYSMITKDKSLSFDFEGFYTKVEKLLLIEYKLVDNRIGSIHFEELGDAVRISEVFQPESGNPESMQEEWCQAVIDKFKQYVESFKK
ncbi:SRPBCC domain-containing protein [Flavobacterium sp. MC2016-06]|jgi:uncharacterized protein YndB with AHSA1/START domain|uniref:SRPBCC domain-containing protein n=1 Tax=Flavobacterium sp. MC2016-06 TaxID=2676308 RepID=UPI0012BA572A|nr:SRPBCC domain-containing protein [Flavobacterium sp. MC2016-06]MBU3861230.1 SRPBCC domain-containing protein [Flavobacterium sp. MC2016-06]